ncbi:unnamed protein product [Brachionus calyciflorus]|uniref:HotDog ACOT-type domain-containing protein n=1 Tax=Brachionus calyciflorus TaxID=104777 RepID=A0A814CTK0_9BILA|nr:unnamed protein product [Brachionus calyciflorus]
MFLNKLKLFKGYQILGSLNRYASTQVPTMHEVRSKLMDLIGYDRTWGDKVIDKTLLVQHVKRDQSLLKRHRMNESFAEAIIPLGDQAELRNRYGNFQQTVRFGRLLEDLDTMAVHIAYLHNKSQNILIDNRELSPVVIVTALVDRIEIKDQPIAIDKNIKLSGFTSWVGKSSCEVTMKLEQELAANVWSNVLEAKFLVCARDTNNIAPAVMNPLEIVTPEEKAIYELGEKSKIIRQNEMHSSLFNMPPNNVESVLIHEMFKKTIDMNSGSFKIRVKPENTVWMEDTLLKNVIICFPEQRNLYNKIFGGFLMRQAYELAWTNACLFSKTTPRCSVVDDISFKRPVLIGSLLFLTSEVVYTEGQQIQVKVHAQTVDPKTSHKETSNDFYFKFKIPSTNPIAQVMPKTYAESMMYIDGKRHW